MSPDTACISCILVYPWVVMVCRYGVGAPPKKDHKHFQRRLFSSIQSALTAKFGSIGNVKYSVTDLEKAPPPQRVRAEPGHQTRFGAFMIKAVRAIDIRLR